MWKQRSPCITDNWNTNKFYETSIRNRNFTELKYSPSQHLKVNKKEVEDVQFLILVLYMFLFFNMVPN